MVADKVIAVANTLAEYPRCFTREELLSFTYADEEDPSIMVKAIEEDSRFVLTKDEADKEEFFIAKKALYYWYARLNDRLARAKEAKLSDQQLTLLLSSLRLDGKWVSPPTEYVKFGQQYYLISPTFNKRGYVFPLAHLLSFLAPSNLKHALKYLFDIHYDQDLSLPAEQILTQSIQDVLNRLTNTQRHIITKRQGILGNTKMTLEIIGQNLGVTRERVRQIEKKCWRRLQHHLFSPTLVAPLLSYVLCRKGSLIVSPKKLKPEIRFVAKCLNFPLSQFPHTDLLVIGEIDERLRIPEEIWKSVFDIEVIVNCLQSHFNLVLIRNDLVTIAEALSPALLKRLTKSQKVYLALKSIGRPAHYSEVADAYYDIFPDPSSEHNIHAVLLREDNGVVWIGTKGTFALEEWGYERPSKTIFDTVTEIVEQRYAKTGKPVPFNVIVAEIGKYRKVIQLSSVVFASHCNPKLERVSGDCFIPKTDSEEKEKDISKDELDRILGEFERRTKAKKMAEPMTYDRALQIANEALEAYKKAETKAEVEEIFIRYGRQGIGYRPLCRIFFSQMPPENAVKAYKGK